MEDDTIVEISLGTTRVALRELNILIDSTEDAEPDPLQDDIFRARDELRDTIDEAVSPDASEYFSVGEVFQSDEGPIQITGIDGSELLVTDPTVTHPQDSRAGSWEIDADLLRADLEDGGVERATLDVVTE